MNEQNCIEHGRKLDRLLEMSIQNADKISNIEEKLDTSILISKTVPKFVSWTIVVISGLIGAWVTIKKLMV